MKNKTLEELIKEYRTEVKWRINPKMEAFIKKVYEAGGEAERENIKQITKNHLWKEAGTYDFDGIAEDIINYLVEKNENK